MAEYTSLQWRGSPRQPCLTEMPRFDWISLVFCNRKVLFMSKGYEEKPPETSGRAVFCLENHLHSSNGPPTCRAGKSTLHFYFLCCVLLFSSDIFSSLEKHLHNQAHIHWELAQSMYRKFCRSPK